MEGINMDRSQTFAHVFHFFHSAGKACLLPFMTLFFRYIGLTAFQTGFVVGAQCIVAVVVSPFWMMCTNRCGRHRFVLMFSISVCIMSGILMSFVPAAMQDRGGLLYRCKNNNSNDSSGIVQVPGNLNETAISQLMNGSTSDKEEPWESTLSPAKLQTTYKPMTTSKNKTKVVTTTVAPAPTMPYITTILPHKPVTKAPEHIKTTTTAAATTSHSGKVSNWNQLTPEIQEFIKGLGYGKKYINGKSPMEFQELKDEMESLLKEVAKTKTATPKHGTRARRDIIASTLESINDKLASLQIVTRQYRTFAMVLLMIIVTEILSAPIESLADNLWFEFLDGLDFLERYGSQRVWSALGLIVFPLCITSIVDRTPCELSTGIHHFLLHFYLYAGTLFVAFVFASCYPIFADRKKIHRRSSTFKGCQVLCIDIHAACYVFTIILFGMASAMVDNFLFWQVDLFGGAELYMGGAISIAALSEFIMYPLSKLMIRKISNAGCLVLALFVLAIRLVFYSFLWTSWPILIAALFHGLSNTLLWACMETYQDFKVNPLVMDRSAKTLLGSIHKAIGYGGGSILSGYLYATFGWSTMLQGGAIGLLGWSVLFCCVQRCVRHKHKVRYAKLLQAEEDQDSDDEEESVYDGDWLEIALKSEK